MNKLIIYSFSTMIEKVKSTRETGWQFKIKNYKIAVDIFKLSKIDITSIEDAKTLLVSNGMKNPKSLLTKIDEIISTGQLEEAKDAAENPEVIAMRELTSVPEIGPSAAKKLYNSGYKSVEDLRKNPDILNRKQKIGLKHYDDLKQRIPRAEMIAIEKYLLESAKSCGFKEAGGTLEITGSYRRGAEDSGDIDCLISHVDNKWLKTFTEYLTNEGFLVDSFAHGVAKFLGICKLPGAEYNRHIDILYSSPSEFPFAVLYFTGSKDFNVVMRQLALNNGYTLSEHGLGLNTETKIKTEKDIFDYLGMTYVEPTAR